ncbi:MAG: dTDP-glucose 4,6-dehydratase [Mariprofundales bacterium]
MSANFTPHTILVTGGAGFIGCNFVRYMLATYDNVQIINLDALTYAGSLDNLNNLPDAKRHTFVHGDICDRVLIDKLLRQYSVDCIVHFAAESHVDNSISAPEIFVKTNVMGTFNLLDAARVYWLQEQHWNEQQCRFHHISTDEVYGTLNKTDPAFTETTPYAPNSPYSASKAGSDHLARAYFHTYGLPITTTNCSNNYGSYQHNEKLIPTIVRHCVQQTAIPVYGDGSNIRDWLYVMDHCSGIDAVIRRGTLGDTYNIGGCNEWANIDIVHLICHMMDEKNPNNAPHTNLISFVTDRLGHDWRYAIDASKMANELNWQPAETFETGIRKTICSQI